MATHTTVTVSRGGVPVPFSPDVPVQIDNMSLHEATYWGASSSHFVYNIYVPPACPMTPYGLQFRDLLTDTATLDPMTGNLMTYRIIDFPEAFMDGHLEIVADHTVGGT
jgi:hypothetical protein